MQLVYSSIYIGEGRATMQVTTTCDGNTLVLALATLGGTTEIEMILSMLCCPRWQRQVQSLVTTDINNTYQTSMHVAVADGFTNECCQCKQSINQTLESTPLSDSFFHPARYQYLPTDYRLIQTSDLNDRFQPAIQFQPSEISDLPNLSKQRTFY